VEEVAAFQLAIPDTRLEHERMIGRTSRADLAHVTEVLEDPRDACQDRRDGSAAPVGPEHHRAAEHDILGEQRKGARQVPGLDRGAKWVHSHQPYPPPGMAPAPGLASGLRRTGRPIYPHAQAFPETGDYVFPAGLATVHIDRDRDIGEYWEPNIWIIHPVGSAA
jgi:hypothetical protein